MLKNVVKTKSFNSPRLTSGNKMKKILIAVKNLLDKFSNNPKCYTTLNTDAERELFYRYLLNSEFKNYLEFGAGGSTFDVLKKTKANVYSVESSQNWIRYMKSWRFIRKNISHGRLNFIYANIGKTREWGYPCDKNSQEYFSNYTQLYAKNAPSPTIVLIDGRFRVACVLSLIINFEPNDITILFHDFWNREHYHVVLKYLETIDRADTLGVFKIKKDINKSELHALYEKYKYICE